MNTSYELSIHLAVGLSVIIPASVKEWDMIVRRIFTKKLSTYVIFQLLQGLNQEQRGIRL